MEGASVAPRVKTCWDIILNCSMGLPCRVSLSFFCPDRLPLSRLSRRNHDHQLCLYEMEVTYRLAARS
jgi:hypothetical protein